MTRLLAKGHADAREVLLRNREALDRFAALRCAVLCCAAPLSAAAARPASAAPWCLGPHHCRARPRCLSNPLPRCPPLRPRLTEALLERNSMSGDEVRAVVEQYADKGDLAWRAAEKAVFI